MLVTGVISQVLDSIQHVGWTHLREISRTDFLELAQILGVPLRRPGGLVEDLRIRPPEAATPRSLSGLHGLGEFPFHTDFAHYVMPPRYVLLRSATPANIRPTTLQSLSAIPMSSSERRILQRRVWLVRGGPIPFYAPVLFGDGGYVRWDAACMTPCSMSIDAFEAWTECLRAVQPVHFEWDLNTVLIIDNWRVLHGRAGKTMNSDSDRLIERISVS